MNAAEQYPHRDGGPGLTVEYTWIDLAAEADATVLEGVAMGWRWFCTEKGETNPDAECFLDSLQAGLLSGQGFGVALVTPAGEVGAFGEGCVVYAASTRRKQAFGRTLWVAPWLRRGGVGEELIRRMVAQAKVMGAQDVVVHGKPVAKMLERVLPVMGEWEHLYRVRVG